MGAIYARNATRAITRSAQDVGPEPNGMGVLGLMDLADLGLGLDGLVTLSALAAHRRKDAVVRTALGAVLLFDATLARR
jgi:hypothetical protein